MEEENIFQVDKLDTLDCIVIYHMKANDYKKETLALNPPNN